MTRKIIYSVKIRWLVHFTLSSRGHRIRPRVPLSFGAGFGFPHSIRRLGHENWNYTLPNAHLLEQTNFGGNISSYNAPVASDVPYFQSLFVFGNENIQVYQAENFQGFSLGLVRSSGYLELSDVRLVGVQPGDIKLFRFGCDAASANVRIETDWNSDSNEELARVEEEQSVEPRTVVTKYI